MATNKSVLSIGITPELVDFTTMPHLDAAKVRAGIAQQVATLSAQGFTVEQLYVDLGETAEAVLREVLAKQAFDCVVIGAGLRTPPHHLLFEKVINAVHEGAPAAKLCFNTSPGDTLDAVRRWT